MAKIRSLLTGKEYDIPEDDAVDPTAGRRMLAQFSRELVQAEEEIQNLKDQLAESQRETADECAEKEKAEAAMQQAIADRDVALKANADIREKAAKAETAAREAVARAQGELSGERALRQAAENRAARAEADAAKERDARMATETRKTPAPMITKADIAAAVSLALDKKEAQEKPEPESTEMIVTVAERDGNGDIKRWAIKRK